MSLNSATNWGVFGSFNRSRISYSRCMKHLLSEYASYYNWDSYIHGSRDHCNYLRIQSIVKSQRIIIDRSLYLLNISCIVFVLFVNICSSICKSTIKIIIHLMINSMGLLIKILIYLGIYDIKIYKF